MATRCTGQKLLRANAVIWNRFKLRAAYTHIACMTVANWASAAWTRCKTLKHIYCSTNGRVCAVLSDGGPTEMTRTHTHTHDEFDGHHCIFLHQHSLFVGNAQVSLAPKIKISFSILFILHQTENGMKTHAHIHVCLDQPHHHFQFSSHFSVIAHTHGRAMWGCVCMCVLALCAIFFCSNHKLNEQMHYE